jgi:CRISPR-associated protein Cas2
MERLMVVSYDIPSNRRRRKVAELLEGYGQRVQYSVFECWLSAEKLTELQKRLKRRIKIEEDSVRFYPDSHLCAGANYRLGWQTLIRTTRFNSDLKF